MRRLISLLSVMVLGCILGSCADPAVVDGQNEIAGELRALRAALLQNSANNSPSSAKAFDRAALVAAMEPMREVLTALARDMDAMQTRQAALTGELKRWSQLLVQSTTAGSKEEVSTLVQRLQQLEAQMQQQDQRHREVEDLLGKALNSTADRLEAFLKRLEAIKTQQPEVSPGVSPDGQLPTPPESRGAPANSGQKSGGSDPAAKTKEANERIGKARRSSARDISKWWFGIAGVALLAGGVFALWLGRENRAAHVESPRVVEETIAEDGVEELWAAAALLGEAVGRLRENGDDDVPVAMTPRASVDEVVIEPVIEPTSEQTIEPFVEVGLAGLDDGHVLDESLLELPELLASVPPAAQEPTPSLSLAEPKSPVEPEPEPAPTPQPRPTPAPVSPVKIDVPTQAPTPAPNPISYSQPHRLTVKMAVHDTARSIDNILATLERDPRVLRRPEPNVTVTRRGLEAEFSVLPSLGAGERAHLELLIRDCSS